MFSIECVLYRMCLARVVRKDRGHYPPHAPRVVRHHCQQHQHFLPGQRPQLMQRARRHTEAQRPRQIQHVFSRVPRIAARVRQAVIAGLPDSLASRNLLRSDLTHHAQTLSLRRARVRRRGGELFRSLSGSGTSKHPRIFPVSRSMSMSKKTAGGRVERL